MSLALIVHGGAGAIAPEKHAAAKAGCAAAVMAGWEVLRNGGAALDAVTAAIVALEDNPVFNAGTGAVLTREGHAELDAGIMEGAGLDVGAVAGLRRVKHPILLARQVLASSQVFLTYPAAETLAEELGLELVDPQHFVEAYRRTHPQPLEASGALADLANHEGKHGTVGAVALDSQGNIVAAASTGGVHSKPSGRIGDTPVAGAGFYAENGVGGVSSTGQGEAYIRLALARRTLEFIEGGLTGQAAAEAAIRVLGERVHGDGGLIVIDATGQVGFARNTTAMSYAFMREDMAEPQAGV